MIKSHEDKAPNPNREMLKYFVPGVAKLISLNREKNLDGKYKYRLAVVAIFKNEAPYLEEWLNYYISLGVDHFYLYNNDSTDGSEKVVLNHPQVTMKTIRGKVRQLDAYNDALNCYSKETQYMAFVDCDEFIYSPKGNNLLLDLDNIFKNEKIGGWAINWSIFGSSGYSVKPKGLVTNNFVHRAKDEFEANRHVKTICNPRKVVGFWDPHSCIYLPGIICVNSNGDIQRGAVTDKPYINRWRINHYFTKSKEEFMMKRKRGEADNANIRDMKDFELHDKNEIYDNGMVTYNQRHNLIDRLQE